MSAQRSNGCMTSFWEWRVTCLILLLVVLIVLLLMLWLLLLLPLSFILLMEHRCVVAAIHATSGS